MIKLMYGLRLGMGQTDLQKVPGFNADLSLDKGSHDCYDVWSWSKALEGIILPQFAYCSYGPCIPEFYCEFPTGCIVIGHEQLKCCSGTIFGRKTCSWVPC